MPEAYPRGKQLKGALFWYSQVCLQILDEAAKAREEQTLELIGSIHKLLKIKCFPGAIFTTLHFLHNLQMGQKN